MAEPESPAPPDGWAAHDLRVAVQGGLDRGAHLLTAGEALVARRLLALRGAPATVFARMAARKPLAFPADRFEVPEALSPDEIAAAMELLQAQELADCCVPWRWRAELATRERLVRGCRRLNLAVGGRRAELERRLMEQTGWDPTPWYRPRHRALVRRLERWATLRAWPRPHDVVLERMGQVTYVPHPVTRGPALHPDRAQLRGWEAVHGSMAADTLTAAAALEALDAPRAPGGLDLRRSLHHVLAATARELEREDPDRALVLYDELAARGGGVDVHFRRARTLEALGRPVEAFDGLLLARAQVPVSERRTLVRAAKRVGRSLGRGVPPERPLAKARLRTLSLPQTGADNRPRWTSEHLPVENAVLAWLATQGREGLHAEGRLWRSLFALVFADAYFLDLPGALPVARLAGPLDLRTPSFRARRPLVDERLAAVRSGDAAILLRDALDRYGGRRVAGLHPDLPARWLERAAAELPGPQLAGLLEHLLLERSGGLPDLYIGAGPSVRLDSHPRRLGASPLLVEVKGPGDTLSDRQRVWIDRLLKLGLSVEVWQVRPA